MRVETGYETEDSFDSDRVLWLEFENSREFIINTKDPCEMELVGGKAFNISRLARKGFAVPEGFCITTEAYDYFMDFNSISVEDENIDDKIRRGVMPPELVEVISDAYHMHLGRKLCAVRSSSPFEDLKSASFAGQYKSFLGVEEDTLLDAVKECWASLWSRRATEYRKNKKFKNENIKMAVLVQEMLPATVSGVLFTEEKIIIEAVWGLGDLLVGGKVIPDHIEVDRGTFGIVRRNTSHKDVMSKIGSGGVEVTEVPEHLQDEPVLKDDYIQELCTLSTQVETLFGCPQDIEWALCSNELILLQARPISVEQEKVVWSRANIVDNLPGYVSYLTRAPENRPDGIVRGLVLLLEQFGIKEVPENIRLTGYFYGHAYLNMTATRAILGLIPGISPEVVDQSLGHSRNEEEISESKSSFSEIMKLIPGTIRVVRFFLGLPERANHVIPYSVELIEDIRNRNLDELNLEELDALVWKMYDRNAEVSQVHAVATMASMSLFGILQKMLTQECGDGTENLLTIGLNGMSSSQLGVEMWNLSRSSSVSSRVTELILSGGENVLEELKQIPEGVQFLEDLDRFIDEFGDRGSRELEISSPRWGENPSFIVSMVANFLSSEADPVKIMEKQRRIRLEATDSILKKYSKNPVKKSLYKMLIEKTQEYIVTRENLKTTWMKGISSMRAVYLAIAEKLVDTGVLQDREDIFYLKMTEVSDLIEGRLKREHLDHLMKERKREREECESLEVPMVIVGKPLPVEELKYMVEPKDKLEGKGCSHGVATGKARVVLDPHECLDLKEDEILIAPFTDPGWSPLFITAKALVMEIGGTLSHGVIIAREYGVPAVVGVKNATKIIKTGQIVTVDGNNGVVYIRE